MKKSGKERSQRQLRVGERVKRVLAEVMQRGMFDADSDIQLEKITVTEVQISPDMKNATVFIMTLGGANLNDALKELNDNAGYFGKEVGRKLDTRNSPRLKFVPDYTFDEAEKIQRLLRETGG